jgi:hypothetical protein
MNAYVYPTNPVEGVDPLGLSEEAMAAAIPIALTAAAADGPLPIGDIVGGVILAGAAIYGLTCSDKAKKAQERKAYSRVCKSPVPPTGDQCKDAKANLDRLKLCLQLRVDFSEKWFNHNPDLGHMEEIENTRKAIVKLEEFLKRNCP